MKRAIDFIKPNILIIFGALFFLYFMNWLPVGGAFLALGIVAIVFSSCYIAMGVLSIIFGDKLPKKIFEVAAVCSFAAFMFAYFLIFTINYAEVDDFMGPTAWLIAILCMMASLALAGIYPVAKFVKLKIFMRFAYLFSAIFALALLLNIVFDPSGNSTVLGNVQLVLVAIYVSFTFYLFTSLNKKEEAPLEEVKEEKPEPEPVVEAEVPQEEVGEEVKEN